MMQNLSAQSMTKAAGAMFAAQANALCSMSLSAWWKLCVMGRANRAEVQATALRDQSNEARRRALGAILDTQTNMLLSPDFAAWRESWRSAKAKDWCEQARTKAVAVVVGVMTNLSRALAFAAFRDGIAGIQQEVQLARTRGLKDRILWTASSCFEQKRKRTLLFQTLLAWLREKPVKAMREQAEEQRSLVTVLMFRAKSGTLKARTLRGWHEKTQLRCQLRAQANALRDRSEQRTGIIIRYFVHT